MCIRISPLLYPDLVNFRQLSDFRQAWSGTKLLQFFRIFFFLISLNKKCKIVPYLSQFNLFLCGDRPTPLIQLHKKTGDVVFSKTTLLFSDNFAVSHYQACNLTVCVLCFSVQLDGGRGGGLAGPGRGTASVCGDFQPSPDWWILPAQVTTLLVISLFLVCPSLVI